MCATFPTHLILLDLIILRILRFSYIWKLLHPSWGQFSYSECYNTQLTNNSHYSPPNSAWLQADVWNLAFHHHPGMSLEATLSCIRWTLGPFPTGKGTQNEANHHQYLTLLSQMHSVFGYLCITVQFGTFIYMHTVVITFKAHCNQALLHLHKFLNHDQPNYNFWNKNYVNFPEGVW
jgi:hypothetical protein